MRLVVTPAGRHDAGVRVSGERTRPDERVRPREGDLR